ncbi:MAG: AAA family ATPase, partial [Clostridia bacterium]|nr:AAA family ATPase [Clostridia bacterium]
MYIKELYIGTFGALKDRRFSFTDGVNLIEGPNESGKSTLCAFIKFIFFGLPARAKGAMSDRKRYLPFDGSAASGTLTLVCAEGEYIISRTFTPSGRGGSDKVEINDLRTGAPLTGDPAELFLGMTEGLFTRTAYIPQLSGGLVDGTEVSAAMENLLYSKDEEIDSSAAIKALEKAATALVHKRGSGGRLNEAVAELDILTAKAAVSGGAGKRLRELEEQISDLSATERENARHLNE